MHPDSIAALDAELRADAGLPTGPRPFPAGLTYSLGLNFGRAETFWVVPDERVPPGEARVMPAPCPPI